MRKTYPNRVLGYYTAEIKRFRSIAVLVNTFCFISDVAILFIFWGIINAVVKGVHLTLILMCVSCVTALLIMFALKCLCLRHIVPFRVYTIYDYCKGRQLVFEEVDVSKSTLYNLITHEHSIEIFSELEDMSECFEGYLNSIYGWRDRSKILDSLGAKGEQKGTEIYKIQVSSVQRGTRRFSVIDIKVKLAKEG